MQTARIRQLIADTIAEDNRSNRSEQVLRNNARNLGISIDQNQIDAIVSFQRAYVENVPALLENVAEAARINGIANQVAPMLNSVEQYFLEPEDFIPDHQGVIGLADDAYMAHKLVQVLSDNYLQQTGTPLLNVDLTEGNAVIRHLIGEPLASMLDTSVMNTIQGPNMQQFIQNLMNFQGMMPMSAPDPIYGNMSAGEIADHRLGMMGIF